MIDFTRNLATLLQAAFEAQGMAVPVYCNADELNTEPQFCILSLSSADEKVEYNATMQLAFNLEAGLRLPLFASESAPDFEAWGAGLHAAVQSMLAGLSKYEPLPGQAAGSPLVLQWWITTPQTQASEAGYAATLDLNMVVQF